MKTVVSLLYWISTFAALIILLLSVGWLLGLFGIGLIPCVILHIIAGTKALARFPFLKKELVLTSLTFLLFALLRPDMDDVNPYTGYSVMLNKLGLRHNQYVHSEDIYFYIATLFLIGCIAMDIYILIKSKRPPVILVNQELV